MDQTIEVQDTWKKFIGDRKFRKVILYAPTWRLGVEATRFFPFEDFNQDKLIEFLEKENIGLLLRPHVPELIRYPKLRKFLEGLSDKTENILMATHDKLNDVNSILSFVVKNY